MLLSPNDSLTDSGHVHSVEAGSGVDGPGMRVVVFLAGCLLRCQFCHNPDTWARGGGREMSAEGLAGKVGAYAAFLRGAGGGVTFSGGEPLYQWPFVREVARRLREEHRMHIAVQTAAFLGDRVSEAELAEVDLWMVDFKSADPVRYREVTAVEQPNMLRFLDRLNAAGRRTWVTYVLVPGLTDEPAHLEAMADRIAPMRNVERVEIRPFHQLGRGKWAALGVAYPLERTETPTPEGVERALRVLRERGVVAEVG